MTGSVLGVHAPDCSCINPNEDFETGNLSQLPWATGGSAGWLTVDSESSSPSHSARSGDIIDDEISYLEVTRNVSAGNVLFCYKVSSEPIYDFLRFYIDGAEKGAWSGEEDWSLGSASVAAGNHTFRWAYEKDYSLSYGSDAAWIDDIEFPSGSGICVDCSCIDPDEDFDTGDLSQLSWATGGSATWTTVDSESSSPSHSARSGDIMDEGITYLEVTRDVLAGNVLFCYKVSSEPGYDFLRFYVDGKERWSRSGEQEWSLVSANVTAGTHTFRWAYEKDYSLSYGSDAAWIDDIEFPGTEPAFRVAATGDVHAAGAFYGAAFETGAADVAEWIQVSTSVEPGDIVEFDPIAPMQYRIAENACSSLVAGVISTTPGVTLGTDLDASKKALLALIGIVPVKVTDEGGAIQPGDLLVTSSTPGHAMRWAGPDPCLCSLVGKALEPMDDEQGVILVLLTAH